MKGYPNRVNMVITKHSIRYGFRKSNMTDDDMDCGELMLPEGAMKNGAIADFELFRDSVAELVREHRWRRKKLAFCLVDDTVFIQEVEIPGVMTASEARGYVETQTGFGFELPFENAAINVDVLQTTKKLTRVRMYAYPKERVEAFEAAFKSAGLVPVIADLTSTSVYRYYEELAAPQPLKHVFLVHWNRDGLYITAFDRNKPVFTRHLKMTDAEKITYDNATPFVAGYVSDILRTLDFYHDSMIKGRARIEGLIVSGDFPYLYEVKRMLYEALELPVFDFTNKPPRRSSRAGAKASRSTRGESVHLEPESNKDMQFRVKYMDLLGLSHKL